MRLWSIGYDGGLRSRRAGFDSRQTRQGGASRQMATAAALKAECP